MNYLSNLRFWEVWCLNPLNPLEQCDRPYVKYCLSHCSTEWPVEVPQTQSHGDMRHSNITTPPPTPPVHWHCNVCWLLHCRIFCKCCSVLKWHQEEEATEEETFYHYDSFFIYLKKCILHKPVSLCRHDQSQTLCRSFHNRRRSTLNKITPIPRQYCSKVKPVYNFVPCVLQKAWHDEIIHI